VRRWLKKYVWMSFAAGFGQTVPSVVGGLGVLAFAAVFIFLQIAGVEDWGPLPRRHLQRLRVRGWASSSPRRF
jgi:hypothetical protein